MKIPGDLFKSDIHWLRSVADLASLRFFVQQRVGMFAVREVVRECPYIIIE